MGRLQEKIAVVTGGTAGIGFATAKRFVDEGAYVFITGRRQKELDEAVKVIGSNVAGVRGDVSKLQDLDRLYETVKAKGHIDVLVANAGTGEFAPLASLTEEHFDKLFDLNVKGTLFTMQKALPLMNDGGSIILIGSVAMGEPDEVAKAAVFLASDDSSLVTGIELIVDGGRGQV